MDVLVEKYEEREMEVRVKFSVHEEGKRYFPPNISQQYL